MTNSKRNARPLVAALLLLSACAGGSEPAPAAGPFAPPGLAGRSVLVFPVQEAGDAEAATREMVFALEGRRGTGGWVLPAELERRLSRSPGLNVPAGDLPVGVFLRAEVRRIGDPLYGMVRRAASLTDATLALLPVAVTFRPAGADEGPAVEVLAAVIDVTSGRVVWLDRAAGAASGPGDPGGVARAMDSLASRLLPAG